MKKSLLILTMLTLIGWGMDAKAQSVNDTVFWHGGWCTICGTDYACSQGAFVTTWNGGTQTFIDPLPIGVTLTGIIVSVCEADCGASNVLVTMNGTPIGTYYPSGTCACYGSLIYTVAGMIGNYNYQGINTLNLGPFPNTSVGTSICVSHATITLIYNNGAYIANNPNYSIYYCQGGSISIPYTAFGNFQNGNIFTAQLSDSSGSFASPDTIGTFASTTSGILFGTIPADALNGTHYRIRVTSSDTAFIGNDNGADITIGATTPVIYPSGSVSFCSGGVLTSSAAVSYLWNTGDTTQSITVTSTGSYSVTTSASLGCSAVSLPTIVTINDSPTVTITPNGPTSFCNGGSVILDAGIDSTYTWSDGSTSETLNVNTSGTYSVTITDIHGCTASTSQSVNVDNLTANAGPDLNVNCGNSTALNIIANGQGTLTYSWSPGTGLSDSTIYNPVATVYNTITYTYIVNDSMCSSTGSVSLYVIPYAPISICIVSVDSTTNKNMVIWDQPSGIPVDSFIIYRETNQSNVYAQIGSQPGSAFSTFIDTGSYPQVQANRYEIGFLDSCGLVATQSTNHKTIHLSINQGLGNTYNLIWDAYEGFAFSSYNIYRGTTLSNMALLTTIASNLYQYSDLNPPLGTVYYAIEVLNPGSCTPSFRTENNNYNISMSNITNSSASGIPGISSESSLNIFPNPASNIITIQDSKQEVLQFTDVLGRMFNEIRTNNSKITIDISSFPNIFFVKTEGGEVRKVVKY